MRGILHRDLKPANILIDEEGRPHVTDFGLAKRVEADLEMTASGAILGTPAYMSPEQANGHRGSITTATDIHGLGAILYAMLTTKAPFGGDSVMATLDAVRSRFPLPPRKVNVRIPRDLETICLKCLEKDPRRRYGSAQALADDLRAWLESRPVTARRVGSIEQAALWCKRRPAIAALSAATLLALVGGTVGIVTVRTETAAAGLVQQLVKADTPEVPGILKELSNYRRWAEPELKRALANSAKDSRANSTPVSRCSRSTRARSPIWRPGCSMSIRRACLFCATPWHRTAPASLQACGA